MRVEALNFWVIFGLLGQFFFFMRFIVQWIVSEKKGKSVIPDAFWYLSIIGGIILLFYSIYRKDPVFILGQSVGSFVYVRNIMLIRKKKEDAVF
ncbi:MAG: lipid-A-disaccharide synthase N-terminal domain-containing protein [Candidatus Omnitrophota bacterium]